MVVRWLITGCLMHVVCVIGSLCAGLVSLLKYCVFRDLCLRLVCDHAVLDRVNRVSRI